MKKHSFLKLVFYVPNYYKSEVTQVEKNPTKII